MTKREELGQIIRYKRIQKGLTRRMLADKIGASEQSIINWEQAGQIPRDNHLKNISEVLDITIEFFIEVKDAL